MEKHKFFLIVNPTAGHGRCHTLFPAVRKELQRRGVEFDHHFTNEPMEAADIAQMVIKKGFTHIVAVGGDGTVNEVVNGMQEMGTEQPLAVIPAGSGNDFCRMNGIPLDPFAAIDVLFDGREITIDLGHVEGDRYFINGVGIGIDATVARDVLKSTRLCGAPAYFVSAVRQVFGFRSFPVTAESEGRRRDYDCISLGIANGQYVGGGFKMAPNADVSDGLLDLNIIEDMPILKRLVCLPAARKGKHLGLSEVDCRQIATVEISSPSRLVAHMDGEEYRLPGSCFRVSAVPNALRICVPQQAFK
jgi:diacylglycerol kinase (ATP)